MFDKSKRNLIVTLPVVKGALDVEEVSAVIISMVLLIVFISVSNDAQMFSSVSKYSSVFDSAQLFITLYCQENGFCFLAWLRRCTAHNLMVKSSISAILEVAHPFICSSIASVNLSIY